jgi:hypothetical protein
LRSYYKMSEDNFKTIKDDIKKDIILLIDKCSKLIKGQYQPHEQQTFNKKQMLAESLHNIQRLKVYYETIYYMECEFIKNEFEMTD